MPRIQLHQGQSEVIQDLYGDNPDFQMRFECVVGSRGFGKTFTAGAACAFAIQELESLDVSVPNKNITILCGSFQQAVDIYYPLLAYQFGFEALSQEASRAAGWFKFPNGTRLQARSAEAFERMRGSGQYLVIADEMPTWNTPNASHKEAWESVIEPCVTTRWSSKQALSYGAASPGRALAIASPKSDSDYFYELSQRQHIDSRWKTRHYTYHDSPLLSQEEIERARKHMDPIRFQQEYLASFAGSTNKVFTSFDRGQHLDESLPYFEDGETVHAAVDFNIMKNCTSFSAIRGGQVHVLDELEGAYNTEELAKAMNNKFPNNPVVAYPDPSGKSRKTSAVVGVTDFSILENAGIKVRADSRAPSLIDSVNSVNRKLMNAAGDIEVFVHPRCTGFTQSIDKTKWTDNRPDFAIIDKSADIEHYSDGFRYFIHHVFPVKTWGKRTGRGFTF
jgi:hypothetical protein